MESLCPCSSTHTCLVRHSSPTASAREKASMHAALTGKSMFSIWTLERKYLVLTTYNLHCFLGEDNNWPRKKLCHSRVSDPIHKFAFNLRRIISVCKSTKVSLYMALGYTHHHTSATRFQFILIFDDQQLAGGAAAGHAWKKNIKSKSLQRSS